MSQFNLSTFFLPEVLSICGVVVVGAKLGKTVYVEDWGVY